MFTLVNGVDVELKLTNGEKFLIIIFLFSPKKKEKVFNYKIEEIIKLWLWHESFVMTYVYVC